MSGAERIQEAAHVHEKPARLSDDDTAYHVALSGRVRDAREAQARISQVHGAWQIWAEYLKDKYGFEDEDMVTEDGTITYHGGRHELT